MTQNRPVARRAVRPETSHGFRPDTVQQRVAHPFTDEPAEGLFVRPGVAT